MKPKNHKLMEALAPAVSPAYASSTIGNHYLAADDYAVILNVRPLYSAGIDGTGQKIAIVGHSQIDTSHHELVAHRQDYFIDDFQFRRPEPVPVRLDLKTGRIRVIDTAAFKGRGGIVRAARRRCCNCRCNPARN